MSERALPALASPGWRWAIPGALAVVVIAGVVGTAGLGLAGHASARAFAAVAADPYVARVAAFTVVQAGLSVLLSIVLAIPFARAAARRADNRFVRFILSLGNLAFVTPVIIGVFGIVQVHGRSGWVGEAARALGADPGNYLYGLSGILIAHLFFNMPFAARAMARSIVAVAPETWRLAAQLGFSQRQIWRLIEWPAMRAVMFQAAAVIFALCFTSFAVVLTLGGGPRATILEVAIYQALRFDFDIDRAVALALVQISLAGAIAIAIAALGRTSETEPGTGAILERPDRRAAGPMIADTLAIIATVLIVVVPLAGIMGPSLAALTVGRITDPALWRAAGWTVAVATAAGSIALLVGIGLITAICESGVRRGRTGAAAALEASGSVILVMPPVLLGAGLFLALRAHVNVLAAGPILVIAVDAIASLPFVIRILGPELRRSATEHDRLCASLGLSGWRRWRIVDWPVIRPATGTALAVATTMAAGDVGVIALFGTPDTATLPLLIYQRMGAYRMDDAAVGVAVLMALTLAMILAIERVVGGRMRDA